MFKKHLSFIANIITLLASFYVFAQGNHSAAIYMILVGIFSIQAIRVESEKGGGDE